jgi:hypothetical protein
MEPTTDDRLFVPLTTEPFRWFERGQKRWELRRYGRQYTERQVRPGRFVELRRGYQEKCGSLWGTIAEVVQAPTLSRFFESVPYHEVIPTAASREDAIRIASEILNLHYADAPVLGFRIQLER